ncbi:glycosyltransferase family 2 protein [Cyclobacteriaceae bacterium YHN15]|nr:glycosyltransferase family 2 protein [Cyclobacteriaceae bacterium YHN15]
MKIAVLLTCFNRKEKTKRCLRLLENQKGLEGIDIHTYLTDDNSPDGTGKSVREEFPDITVGFGNGQLFWAGGMRNSWNLALLSGNEYDYYFLLNDDTYMFEDTLRKMISSNRKQFEKYNVPNITIGTTIDDSTKKITYGGYRLYSKLRLKHFLVNNPDQEEACDLGCANLMLVPASIVNVIGILGDNYIHGVADFDYTMKAKKAGFGVFVAPGILGTCTFDHGKNWKPQSSTLKDRIEYLYSPKGLAYKEFMFFIRQFFPVEVPFIFSKLWIKTLFPIVYDQFKGERQN